MKRKLAFLMSAVLAVGMFSGCVTREQKKENRQNTRQACRNAENYIKEKYGFDAKAIDAEPESSQYLLQMNFSGYIYVRMEYGGKQFTVYIDGKNESTNGLDNYQQDEITADIEKNFRQTTGIDCESLNLYNDYKKIDDKSQRDMNDFMLLYNTYYTGSNMDELCDERDYEFSIGIFGNQSTAGITEKNFTALFGENMGMVYLYNDDAPSSSWYSPYNELNPSGGDYYPYCFAPYIKESISYGGRLSEGSKFRITDIPVKSAGDMLYMTPYGSCGSFEKTAPADFSDGNTNELKGSVVCADTYIVPECDNEMYVYFRKDMLPDNGKNCVVAYKYTVYDETTIIKSDVKDAGEYICGEVGSFASGGVVTVVKKK